MNDEQRTYWAGEGGEHWVREAARYDAMIGPFGERVLEVAALAPGEHVLDVGCGNGATTIEAARRVSPDGSALGVDLSVPMLGVARSRAEDAGVTNATFLEADAQTHAFDGASFDAVISRFGVMFFEDPAEAFANIARAVRPGGRITFVCWQDMMRCEWIMVPAGAIVQHVGMPDVGEPGAPGPFALADRDRLTSLLVGAGLTDVEIEDTALPMRMGRDLDDVETFLRNSDMSKRLFDGKPAEQVEAAVAAAREALAPYAKPDGVVLGGSAWVVSARR